MATNALCTVNIVDHTQRLNANTLVLYSMILMEQHGRVLASSNISKIYHSTTIARENRHEYVNKLNNLGFTYN
jgi:CTP synthase (UTP-ammonia lyase)